MSKFESNVQYIKYLVNKECASRFFNGELDKEVNMEKFGSPRRMASFKAMRWTGAVVSKPIAKNTISLSGFSSASDRASKGVYSIRISAPLAFTLNKSSLLPGTRIISPKEAKITFGCVANFKA